MRALTIASLAVMFAAGAALLPTGVPAASNSTLSIDLPAPNVQLKPGPNRDVAAGACLTCHSSDYIYYQPALTKAQWTAEVNKMRNAFAAPIPEANVAPIVEYLMSQNGKT